MASAINGISKFVSSLLTFTAFMLTIAIVAYQVFAPEGHVFLWLEHLWDASPILVIALAGGAWLLKRKLDGQDWDASLANALLYLVVLIGLVAGISWLL